MACGKAPNLEHRLIKMVEAQNRHDVTRKLASDAEEDRKICQKGWSDVMGWLGVAHPELVKEAQLNRFPASAIRKFGSILILRAEARSTGSAQGRNSLVDHRNEG